MTSRRWIALTAAALLLVALPAAGQSPPPSDRRPLFQREPAPERLVLPVLANDTQRLLEEGNRTVGFCEIFDLFEDLGEPKPDDAAELAKYAERYSAISNLLDPMSEVEDVESRRRGARTRIPPELVTAMRVVRQEMYFYMVRLQHARGVHDRGGIDDARLQSWLDHYFAQLVNSGYTVADRELVRQRSRYCR